MAAPTSSDNKVPQGMLVVDRFGKRRAQQAVLGEGDRLAYPPALNLEYGHDRIHMFGGTIPVYTIDARLDATGNQRRYVDWMIEQDKNEKVLFEAVFYLSQSQEGRNLLSEARARGFKFVFDRRTTAEANANALCDFENKLIPISPNTNPIQLMLTLAHELDHMHVIGKGIKINTHQTFTGFIKASRTLEGAARVREAGIAFGFEQIPAGYFKPPGIVDYFAWKLPHMADAARQALKQGHAVSSDEFKRGVFMGFHKQTDTLAYYDRHALGIFETRLQELQKTADPAQRKAELAAFMGKDSQSPGEIAGALPYLKGVADLGGATYTKLIPDQDIKDRHAALAEAMKTAYEGADVAGRIGAVFDEPESVKPGLLAAAAARVLRWFPTRTATQSAGTKPPVTRAPLLVAAESPRTIVMPSIPELEQNGHTGWHNKFLAKGISQAVNYRSVNDVLHLALSEPVTHMNQPGHIREMIGLGLRAPIGAFPDSYLRELCGHLRFIAGQQGNLPPAADMAIFAHWKMLANKGVDPISGGEKTKAVLDDNMHWAAELARAIGEVKTSFDPIEHVSRDAVMQWASEQAKLREPERRVTPLMASVPRGHGRQ